MAGEHVLVVDDDAAVRTVLVGLLSQAGYAARAVASAEAALREVAAAHVDLVVTDLRMPGTDGLALVAELARVAPDVPAVMLTAHGTVPLAVEAMKAGAKEFLLKPFDRDEVVATIDRVLEAYVRAPASRPPLPPVGPVASIAPAMQRCEALLARAAKSASTVLLRGESGTGKEVAARALHAASARARGPFVPVHCAALPDALLESELFGYEKGA
ncbi:MAG TPA: response regulator, partial [Minicystis sp.]|nr:response regulator [Minicystis sp.]